MSLMALSSDPSFPPKSSASQPLRRSGRARTTRVRDDFFDVDILQYMASPDEPMAFADEGMPATHHKKSPVPKASTPPATVPLDYQQADDRSIGPSFQATNIPVCRPRPTQPTARDAKFLQATLLCAPSSSNTTAAVGGGAAAAAVFKAQYMATPDCAGRRVLLNAAVAELDAQMGPRMVQVLSLGLLGAKCRSKWQKHEELLFCLGMCDKYRMFKYIRQCYLWSRSAHELNGYYHNVWKTRSTAEADEFLALRERHASSADMQEFVDKIRDQLTSTWDRKKMGDMPKLLKDAAALAAADAELFAAAAAGLNPQGSDADEDYASPSSSAGAVSGDSGSCGRAAASKPARRRKRPAAAAAAASSKQARVPVKRGVTPPVQQREGADVQVTQQQQQQRGQVGLVKQEQQQPKRQRQQQQQQQQEPVTYEPAHGASTAAAAAAAAADSTVAEPAAGGVSSALPFPEMPTYPNPDMTNPDDVSSWLTHLPVYRGVISTYMQTVNSVADAAVAGYQQRIQEVQQHRDRLQAEADAYIRGLLAQGKQVLQRVQDGTANSQQQQGHERSAAPAQQQQQQQQQPQQPGPAVRQAGAAAAGDLQSAVQALLSSHGHRTKKQVQAKQAVLQQQAVTQVQQQQQQEPVAEEAALTLPVPGGPASKWLISKVENQAGTPSAGVKQGMDGDTADTPCGGASSSEECDMFLACTEPAVC